MNVLTGWATWKERTPYDLCLYSTERSLLVSYDMIPVRGLPQTKRFLRSRGITVCRSVVTPCSPSKRHGYCLSIGGRLDAGSLAWTINHRGGRPWKVQDRRGVEALCFASACYYLTHLFAPVTLPESDSRSLARICFYDLSYSDPTQARDKRSRHRVSRDLCTAREVFARNYITLQPIRFAKEPDDA